MDRLTDLLFGESSVIVSSLLAAAAIPALAWLVRRGRPLIPSAVIVAVAAAVPLAGINLDRYAGNPLPHYPPWIVVVAALSLIGFAGSALGHRHDRPAELALTWATAAIAIGLFLAVPETGALRTTLGPLVLVAAAATRQWLPPFGAAESVAAVAALAWMAAIDGTTRSTTLLGLAIAVTVAAAMPRLPRPSGSGRLAMLIVPPVAIVIGCRLAGTSETALEAALYGAVTIVVVAMVSAVVALTGTRPRSEQFDGAHR